MPNHVRNLIKFTGITKDKIIDIVNRITTTPEGGLYPLDNYMDFDKIIPEPRTEDECPDDCKVNSHSHIEADEDRPWFDWYTWRNRYWNTKWGAYDGYIKVNKTSLLIVFSTAWSVATPIVDKLKDLGYNFEWRYADEDLGHNCGKFIYNKSKTGFTDFVHLTERDFADPVRYARRLWDTY